MRGLELVKQIFPQAHYVRLMTAMETFFPNLGSGRLQLRSDLHLARKFWHCSLGCLIAFLYQSGMSTGTAVLILSLVLALDLSVELARLRIPAVNDIVVKCFWPFMRQCELSRLSGTPYYLSATLLAIAIFPRPVAVLSILYLAFGDPVASFFGILYGHRSVAIAKGKSLIGCLAGVVTCVLVTFFFLKSTSISDGSLIALSLLGGLAGGAAELVPLDVDDNFTIPVVSGFALWLVFIVFGI